MLEIKTTWEEFYIGLRFEPEDLPTGETITNVDVSVDPVGLTLSGSPSISGDEVSEYISGGTVDVVYAVTFQVTISNGNKFEKTISVQII